MRKQHGLPRVAKENDAEKERKNIAEYRRLVNLVTLKVRITNLRDGSR